MHVIRLEYYHLSDPNNYDDLRTLSIASRSISGMVKCGTQYSLARCAANVDLPAPGAPRTRIRKGLKECASTKADVMELLPIDELAVTEDKVLTIPRRDCHSKSSLAERST